MPTAKPLSEEPAWNVLKHHYGTLRGLHLRQLFVGEDGAKRTAALSGQLGELFIDYSKHCITDETVKLLIQLAEARDVRARIDDMFAGKHINGTEDRAVMHVALRDTTATTIFFDDKDVLPDINETLDRMRNLADAVRSGSYMGASGKAVRNVVSLGIGGSNLGPAMSVLALTEYVHSDLTFKFVSNVDPADFAEAVKGLDPAETLFIISSKTFTTQETMANADRARRWIVDALGEQAPTTHFIALSTNLDAAAEFGIPAEHVYGFWDWVGGRYSLTSAIGLPVMIAVGGDKFDELRRGFHDVDVHFKETPLAQNLPVILGMIGLWYRNFGGGASEAVIPYSHYLRRFPAYCQQLVMESNGKAITMDGQLVNYPTSQVIWGEPGTDAQHSFFQMLHQGTSLIPVHFIGVRQSAVGEDDMQRKLLANMLAQSEALAFGRERHEGDGPLAAHKTFSGNRPSTTILMDRLTPAALGQLIALYEHMTFVQGAVWNINSFDQFGVELGKHLASQILHDLSSDHPAAHDASTAQLIARVKQG